MDRRSWPWKKRSSEKSLNTDVLPNQAEQDQKIPKFIQISPERYARLTESEEQIEKLTEKMKVLNEKNYAAEKENTAKDGLVKQHAKVAEEAVSGWEQAEAEALALKLQLETVTLSKLAAEERASHLDDALKECMKQVRIVKEESEQKLHDVVLQKTKHWEKIKANLEEKLAEFEQELIRAGDENDAFSRSIEERALLLMKVDEEKAQAEAQIEVLKNNIQSGEKDINSLKYELHVVSKELDIRNEEKNMSARSADVATKQHLEDAKKISKLEAECQRLRGLVRKKLPGPAALAQMKMEVDSWGRDLGDNRLRCSPSKSCNFKNLMSPSPDYALENFQSMQKENEHFMAHLSSMEEENNMLKNALSKCNNELQISKSLCAKTTSKLRSMELHMLGANLHNSPTHSYIDVSFDGASTQKGSNSQSRTSMSEDGVDDGKSCAGSWPNSVVYELSQFTKEKGRNRSLRSDQMELMDDFLEMERLAWSFEAKGCDCNFDNETVLKVEDTLSTVLKKESEKNSLPTLLSPISPSSSKHLNDHPLLFKLHSGICSFLSSQSTERNVVKVLVGIRNILRDIEETESLNVSKSEHVNIIKDADNGTSINQAKPMVVIDQGVKNAVSNIHEFVKSLVGQATGFGVNICNHDAVSHKITHFSSLVDDFLSDGNSLNKIVIALSEILLESGIKLRLLRERVNDAEISNVDCIDKVTLLEKKVLHEPTEESVPGVCSLMPHSSSCTDFLGSPSDAFNNKTAVRIWAPEEYKNLKLKNRKLEMELMLCNGMIESMNLKFGEMEKDLEELTSKLASCERANSLAETQLKCMSESYKTLESQKVKLEEEIKVLLTKIDTLSADLAEQRQSHQHDIAKYRNLEEKMERYEKDSLCAHEDSDTKLRQEKEIAAAAKKLAQCQETILLLGQQLQTLRPSAEPPCSVPNKQLLVEFSDKQAEQAQVRHSKKMSGQFDAEYIFSSAPGTGNVSPLNGYNTHKSTSHGGASPYFTSPSSSKRPKHRSRSSSFSNLLPDKQGRVFGRLFSKGK